MGTGCLLAGSLAEACIVGISPLQPPNPVQYLFPNWSRYEVVDWGVQVCDDAAGCLFAPNATISGITIFNYGTANGTTDITGMYLCWACSNGTGSACSPAETMTYAGVWNIGGTPYPAWTWTPPTIPDSLDYDPCNVFSSGCSCIIMWRNFIDIGPCPTPGATVRLGPGYNATGLMPGGFSDGYGCNAPGIDTPMPAPIPIAYVFKDVNADTIAPGDTVTYSIYYGKPGSPNVGPITIIDSLPAGTHYLYGSAVPPPDAGWDPDPGPPAKLRWTIGSLPTAGGITYVITFKVTVDWGNGDAFEPGSGDTAAGEGAFLGNRAQGSFGGTACPITNVNTNPVNSVVRRFLFWKLADNDMVYSALPGQPADEITYSIFLKNMSTSKTWWNCVIWDTAPPTLDPWASNMGFDDSCLGWTMTPSGCASGSPGRVVGGGATILTWRFDLPPAATMTVRWKAQVRTAAQPGQTAINRASILTQGRTGLLGGSGSSIFPRNFTHLARIELPTTYLSYVGFGAESDTKGACPGYFLAFFPLNKKTQFELRGIEYKGAGWATTGGVSQSIGCYLGDCLGGYPGSPGCTLGSGAITGGGQAGCKVERAPSWYDPTGWQGICPTYPAHAIYKLTSNSPVVWQMLSHEADDNQDNHTYAPATTISFTGTQHYMFRRSNPIAGAGYGDSLSLISTGADAFGVYQPNLQTTVHLFKWNALTLSWDYRRSYELGGESQAYDMATTLADEGPWMTASSDTQLIVEHGHDIASTLACCCVQCSDNFAAFFPTRETGNVTSIPGQPANFYGLAQGYTDAVKVIIGNIGVADADYEVWKYLPDNPVQTGTIPADLNGTTGTWALAGTATVPAGLANAGNPIIYSRDGPAFNAPSTSLFKVKLLNGGPIQVLGGVRLYQNYSGGAVLHAADGNQTGIEFWFHNAYTPLDSCNNGPETYTVDLFCPKQGMAIRGQSEDGYSATYTTTGPDQCVSFVALTNPVVKRNWRFDQLVAGAGNVVAQYIQCRVSEKGWTAPFVQTGTHYLIIAPPVVYAGQSFWITVTVMQAGATKTDYCGTTTFTSTDPTAKIEGNPLETYNFTWDSSAAGCTGCTLGCDNGVRVFVNVVFNRLGFQTMIATDVLDGSITGITAVNVVAADIKLHKEPRLAVAASSDTVQFRICWSNYSSASAFTFVITDAVPMATGFLPEAGTWALNCGATTYAPIQVAYSTATTPTMPLAGSFTQNNPVAATRWLRWTIPLIGVNQTGCACFRVTVN